MVTQLKNELEKLGIESFYPDSSKHSDYFVLARGLDAKPKLIILPRSENEVQKIIKKLNEHEQPAVIIAGKTGLVSAQRAQGEVVIDISKLDQFISINFENGDSFKFSKRDRTKNPIDQAEVWRDEFSAFINSKSLDENSKTEYLKNASFTAEAGVAIGTADYILRAANLMFPVEADSVAIGGGATLGAAAANRMNGEEFRYGTSADQCLQAVAINGAANKTENSAQQNRLNKGLENEVKLRCDALSFENSSIGSEGTFSLITQARFKAQPVPQQRDTFLIKADSAVAAQVIKKQTLDNFPEVTRIEIFNDYAKDSVQKLNSANYKNLFAEDITSPFYLYADLKDIGKTEIEESAGFKYYNFLSEKLGFEEEKHFVFEGDAKDQVVEYIPRIRKCMTEASDKIAQSKGDKTEFRTTFDVGIPAKNFAKFTEKLKELEQKHGVKTFLFGHFAKDAFHLHIHTDKKLSTVIDDETLKKKISDFIFDNVYALNGTCFTEHGVGQHNADYWVEKTDNKEVARWLAEKLENDPKNIINPHSNNFDKLIELMKENSPKGQGLRDSVLSFAQQQGLKNCVDSINKFSANSREK